MRTKIKSQSIPKDDPDPWAVISLVVATVSMFGQLACLKLQASATSRGPSSAASETAYERLRNAIHTAEGNVERLIRVLGQSQGNTALRSAFRFGETGAFFRQSYFTEYQRLVADIALDAGNISTWTLLLISHDSSLAKTLGEQITMRLGDIRTRINSLHTDHPTNEMVLEECLSMLRSFSQMLAEIDKSRN